MLIDKLFYVVIVGGLCCWLLFCIAREIIDVFLKGNHEREINRERD